MMSEPKSKSLTEKESRLSEKQKKIISIVSFVLLLLFTGVVGWFVGKPMIRFVSEPDQFRQWVSSHGPFSRFAFLGMIIFQVVIALVPGEPFEIGAGYAFGAPEGTLLCLAGATIGGTIVFLLVRKFGVRLLEVFFSVKKIQSLKFLQNEKRLTYIIFVIFLIPGTPKDLIGYFGGLTDIKLSKWILITTLARLPAILTSTLGGSALGLKDYKAAAVVFGSTLIISIIGLIIYNRICYIRDKKDK